MSETLSNAPVTYVKLKEVGEKVAGTFDSLAWDVMGTFGLESSIRLVDGDGNLQQLRLDAQLISTFKGHQTRLVPGQSTLVITYTGKTRSKKDASKSYKTFDVKADGLLPKGGNAPGISPPGSPPASIGDDTDVPF